MKNSNFVLWRRWIPDWAEFTLSSPQKHLPCDEPGQASKQPSTPQQSHTKNSYVIWLDGCANTAYKDTCCGSHLHDKAPLEPGNKLIRYVISEGCIHHRSQSSLIRIKESLRIIHFNPIIIYKPIHPRNILTSRITIISRTTPILIRITQPINTKKDSYNLTEEKNACQCY